MITQRQIETEKKVLFVTERLFPWLCVLWMGYALYSAWKGGGYVHLVYVLLYMVGLTCSLLLSARLFGRFTRLASLFCRDDSDKSNCDAVIASRGGYVLGEVTWSDVGIVYFAYMLLLGLFSFQDNAGAYILSSFLTCPYVLYSIYYQGFVARRWCPLCLSVQGVLLLSFGWSCLLLHKGIPITDISCLFPMILLLFTLTAAYLLIKQFLKTKWRQKQLEQRFNSFKTEQKGHALFVSEKTELPGSLVFHPSTPNRITVIFRFGCTPCIFHLNEIIASIEQNPSVAIEFIFKSNKKHLQTELPLMLYFSTLYHTKGAAPFLDALKRYIADYPLSRTTFATRWNPNQDILPAARQTVKEHIAWCVRHHIHATPAYLLNSRFVNPHYHFTDLLQIIQ